MPSRRLDISSLLCNEESVPDPVILAPHLRYSSSNTRQQPRSPSPAVEPPTVPDTHHSQMHRAHIQSTLLPSYSLPDRSPPTGSNAFNGLDALVHAATEERRRLSASSSGTSPPDSLIRDHARHYQRLNQSPPAEHYSYSPTQQPPPFQRPSPVLSPIYSILTSPTTVRSHITSSHHLLQPQQHCPGRPHALFERTPSYPSPNAEGLHLSHSHNSVPSQAHLLHRQQVDHDCRLELQRSRHQEHTYREEQRQSSLGQYDHVSPSSSSRSYMVSQHDPAKTLQIDLTSRHPELPLERDRSSIHNLCLPSQPSTQESPSYQDPFPHNKRRYSETQGPSPAYDESQLAPPRAAMSREHDSSSSLSSSRPRAVPQHTTERKYLGLAEMMSPAVDDRSFSDRSEKTSSATMLSNPPRKRTPPGSSEGRAKAMKNMADSGRNQVTISTEPRPPFPRNDDFAPQSALEARSRKHSLEEQLLHDQASRPRSLQIDNPDATSPKLYNLSNTQMQVGPNHAGKTPRASIDVSEKQSASGQRTLVRSPDGFLSPTLRGKQERPTAVGHEKFQRDPVSTSPLESVANQTFDPKVRLPGVTRSSESKSSVLRSSPRPSPPKSESKPSGGYGATAQTPPHVFKNKQDVDAHEWFLEQFDDNPPDTQSVCMPSSEQPTNQKPSNKKWPGSREMNLPLAVAEESLPIDQELEALVSDSPVNTKVEASDDYDMDVDLAVNQLVAETLDADAKAEENPMEVDVDNELLSLVEDPSLLQDERRGRSNHASSNEEIANDSTVANPPTSKFVADRQVSDRGSMPPPATLPQPRELKEQDDKQVLRASSQTPMPTKKESAKKTKATIAPKAKAKVPTKAKAKATDSNLAVPAPAKSKGTASNGRKNVSSRSRSASVKPSGDGSENKPPEEEEPQVEPQEEDKLYCVCKTKYDEDKFMIACDKCDEWYHTQCVKMPDLEVDLVDQFICPPCIEKNPDLHLRTTYKPRCLFGLVQDDPDSLDACHKPARGAFSKYCSEECGVNYMHLRLSAWTKKGGKKDKLWESVKNAHHREGVVVYSPEVLIVHEDSKTPHDTTSARIARDLTRLNQLLDSVVFLREEIKKGLDVITWREKLVELASERAEQVGECGWDQRLCFGDSEWADFGSGVLETYDEASAEEGIAEGFGTWWCPGKAACDRHNGWQGVRYREISHDKEQKEDALHNLTTRERELRKRIEDLLAPQDSKEQAAAIPLKPNNSKMRGITSGSKKSRKRKAPS